MKGSASQLLPIVDWTLALELKQITTGIGAKSLNKFEIWLVSGETGGRSLRDWILCENSGRLPLY